MLIEFNFFSFIIGNFCCWANFLGLLYFVLDFRSIDFFFGFGPRVLARRTGSDMEKPGPNPTRCHFYLFLSALPPSLSPPRPSLLIATSVIWVCVGYGWACSYEFGGFGFRSGGWFWVRVLWILAAAVVVVVDFGCSCGFCRFGCGGSISGGGD